MCNGCGTSLAGVVKMNSSTMQQIGFAFPGIDNIIMVNMLDIEGEVSNIRLLTFYFTPADISFHGLFSSSFSSDFS
jgi:hypothetical protein